ncbi:glycosyltransferase family 2 protein [Ferroacidibacillus organovorans]|uniref:Glycosyl transferase family 2 n=1 Tax=Ferroacidibacillus organovorans TaxID=1765683 RepID=A0A101XQP9_9BACL|nr:glycosyl transferase family 2 [Ferroacidibacillus organovorans]
MISWTAVLTVAFIALQAITGLIGLYQVVLSVFGLVYRRKPLVHEPAKRFAVFVAAHNEERVIAPLLTNLKRLDYPQSMYDIYVIADNCTDRTAEIAREHGVFAEERLSETERGKGYAIRWMLERLKERKIPYDAVVMFDADNLVGTNFLRVMNDRLLDGHKVIQGYLDIKNPLDSWVSVSMAISYWYTNRMWQLSRRNLGLSCALGGTGLCIDMHLINRLGWEATGLTEDVEFGAKCVVEGIYPVWAHEAKVYDEKPITLVASMRQRLRWMQGHFNCAQQYMGTLLVASLKERSLAKLDAAIYLFQPMRFLILFLTAFMFLFQNSNPTMVAGFTELLPTWFWAVINLFILIQMPLAMLLERVEWRAFIGLPLFPFFMLTWFPVTAFALFTRRNRVWKHTVHTRAIQFDDLRTR